MDTVLHGKLMKGNMQAYQQLQKEELNRLWFVCYHITKETATAAPLLQRAWQETMEEVLSQKQAPKKGFQELAAEKIRQLVQEGSLPAEAEYADIAEPRLPAQYQSLVDAIDELEQEQRALFLLHIFGKLSYVHLAEAMATDIDEIKQKLKTVAMQVQSAAMKLGGKQSVQLTTAFQYGDGRIFQNVQMDYNLVNEMEHGYVQLMQERGRGVSAAKTRTTYERNETKKELQSQQKNQPGSGKERGQMNQIAPKAKRKARRKLVKWIVAAVLAGAVILAAVLLLMQKARQNVVSTRITTYNATEITYGNVNTTISGSGSLTPVTSETLTVTQAATVESVNFVAGEAVEEGDVIAKVTYANPMDGSTQTAEIEAPYDGILLEVTAAEDDELAAGGSVAMIMGLDGFTMTLSVSEDNISLVALEQEVEFEIDAVEGDFVGSVTNISYNGSSSGGGTSFKLTATVEHIDGVYPGMSASAEIVIEDSGDGLIVPVEAVRTSGDTQYVYLAPASAVNGSVYESDELELSSLTKVEVETGMSDGSYMRIDSDELSEGDLVVITTVTSTLDGSEVSDDATGGMGGFGGFGGGMMPGGMGGFGGGDFNFEDMEDFDFSQMPQGGFGGGMGFGG